MIRSEHDQEFTDLANNAIRQVEQIQGPEYADYQDALGEALMKFSVMCMRYKAADWPRIFPTVLHNTLIDIKRRAKRQRDLAKRFSEMAERRETYPPSELGAIRNETTAWAEEVLADLKPRIQSSPCRKDCQMALEMLSKNKGSANDMPVEKLLTQEQADPADTNNPPSLQVGNDELQHLTERSLLAVAPLSEIDCITQKSEQQTMAKIKDSIAAISEIIGTMTVAEIDTWTKRLPDSLGKLWSIVNDRCPTTEIMKWIKRYRRSLPIEDAMTLLRHALEIGLHLEKYAVISCRSNDDGYLWFNNHLPEIHGVDRSKLINVLKELARIGILTRNSRVHPMVTDEYIEEFSLSR